MVIANPSQLVDEFKKSGEFDRLRRELLAEFQRSDSIGPFTARVEDISRQRLNSDQRLRLMPQEAVHRELMQEIDRYPIVERAVADLRMLSDPSFTHAIRASVEKIMKQNNGNGSNEDNKTNEPPSIGKVSPSADPTPAAGTEKKAYPQTSTEAHQRDEKHGKLLPSLQLPERPTSSQENGAWVPTNHNPTANSMDVSANNKPDVKSSSPTRSFNQSQSACLPMK